MKQKTKKLLLAMRKSLMVCLLVLVCTAQSFAQGKQVKGVVKDENGKPVQGVTVAIKGSSQNTITNEKGEYIINVPSDDATLVFTYVGMTRKEAKTKSLSTVDISLAAENQSLDDVVVIGYGGSQKTRNVTGSIVSLDPKKLEDIPVATVTEALRGQIPGVNVVGGSTRPGTMPSINIRQQFNWGKDGGSTAPLIVIDDIIQVDPATGKPSMDRFNLLDISEVESITVLRDASAAIYGSRASQGAIVIKTKRGKSGVPKITYSGKFETNDAVSHGKVMNAHDFGVYSNRFGRAAGWNANSFFSNAELASMDSLNYDWLHDWKKGSAMQHSLTVSGGSDRATYFTGASIYSQTPNLGSQDFKRWSFRAGTDIKVVNNLKLSATIAATNANLEKSFTKINFSDGFAVGGEQNDYSVLLHMPKYIPWTYNINGVDQFVAPALSANRVGSATGNNSLSNWNYYNLLDNGSTTTNKAFGYNANFSLQYDVPFLKGLYAKVTYGISSNSSNTEQIQMPLLLSLANNTNTADNHLYTATTKWNAPVLNRSNSRVTYDNTTGTSEQINFFLGYDKSFGQHNVSAMVSGERTENNSEDRYQIYDNPIPGAYNGTSVSAGTLNPSNTITFRQESGTLSYFGRVSYNYSGKYLAQFVFRSDASSRFAPENYWGFFPSLSLGWVVSEEKFFDVNWMNYFKIRGSIGKTGNDNVNPWKWVQLYKAETDKGSGFGTNGGALVTGLTPEVAPNRDIRWDQTIQRNIGFDLGFFKRRLSVNIDGYYNSSTDMLTSMGGALNVPISVGGAFAEQNYGAVNYWGTEIAATWNGNIGKDISYSVGMNFALSDNKVEKYIDQPFGYPADMGTGLREGYSTINPVWGFKTWRNTSSGDGILRTDADVDAYWKYLNDLATAAGTTPNYLGITSRTNMKKGMLAYEDQLGALDANNKTIAGKNGQIVDEQDYVKLAKSSRTYGITSNLGFTWKSLSLMAQVSATWGGYNTIDRIKQGTSSTNAMWAPPVYLNDMYDSTDNPNGKYPNMFYYDNAYKLSDFWAVSGFRLVVRSLSVGYTLPKQWISKVHMENARLILSGYNLWDLYNPYPNKYRNMYDDPKISYPTLRTWSLGLNVSF